MSDIDNLKSLRDKLLARRRTLVSSLLRASPEQLTGDSISRIQSAINAVDGALKEGTHVSGRHVSGSDCGSD